jgi:hypothetical protein
MEQKGFSPLNKGIEAMAPVIFKMDLAPEETINKIMTAFDFELLHKAMKRSGHRWTTRDKPRSSEVPSVELIKLIARQLLESVSRQSPNSKMGTGGLHAEHSSQGELSLSFYDPTKKKPEWA